MARIGLTLLAGMLLSVKPAAAQRTLIVDDDGRGSMQDCDSSDIALSTIGGAIAVATTGNAVLVCPGTYVEHVNFAGKAITVRSTNGPLVTIIDGNGTGTVATFASSEGPLAVLDGFTLRNGRADSPFNEGGGIRIANASPTILNNHVIDNRACAGGGIAIAFGSPLVRGNLISGNVQAGCSGGSGGGGIAIRGQSTARISGNTITDNVLTSADGGGISLFAVGAPVIDANVIARNRVGGLTPCAEGGGIWMVNQSDALIIGNLIVANEAGCGGGIYWLVPSGTRGPVMVNNTLAGNNSPKGSGILADGFDAAARMVNNIIVAPAGQTAIFCDSFNDLNPPIIQFNNVFTLLGPASAYGGSCTNQTGLNGNISADPQFVNEAAGNYHLSSSSPSIDAGNSVVPELALTPVDLDRDARIADGHGNGIAIVDMGSDEFVTRDLALDFGPDYGVWRFVNPSGWQQIHPVSPETMITGDLDGNGRDDLIVDFGPTYHVWAWMNHATWTRIPISDQIDPQQMVTGDLDGDGRDEVIMTVNGGILVYSVNKPEWFTAVAGDTLAVGNIDGIGGDEVVANVPGAGVWILRNATWTQLHRFNVSAIAIGDLDGDGMDDVVLDFPGYGLWMYQNDGTWTPLHERSSTHLAVGDLDGSGRAELIVDFGPPYGLWIFANDTNWTRLHPLSAEGIVIADLDGDGRADATIDFGAEGVWVFKNNNAWQKLHGSSPEVMTAGRLH